MFRWFVLVMTLLIMIPCCVLCLGLAVLSIFRICKDSR